MSAPRRAAQGFSTPADPPAPAAVAPAAGEGTPAVGVGVAAVAAPDVVQVLVLVLLARRLPRPWRSPLAPDRPGGPYPTGLRGGRVDDPAERAAIAARVAYGELPWWRRWSTRPPAGWRAVGRGRPAGAAVTR